MRQLLAATKLLLVRTWRERYARRLSSLYPGVTRLQDIANDMAAALDYPTDASWDPGLALLLRLRVAQMHPRSRCIARLMRAANEADLSAAKIAALQSWRDSDVFSEHELAALAYAESLTAFDQRAFATTHARLSELFDPRDVDEITSLVIIMNVWARFKRAR
ncbi:carboxymuconolactone decarboxylase family protein [Microbacterium sp. NPDC089318]